MKPGESKTVEIVPEPLDETEYSDVCTVPEAPAKLPITMESRFTDFQQTFMGRRLYGIAMMVPKAMAKKTARLPDGPEKDNKTKGARFIKKMLESNSMRSLSMEAGKTFPYNYAQAFTELANGHIFRGIGFFFRKIKVPKLPKDQVK